MNASTTNMIYPSYIFERQLRQTDVKPFILSNAFVAAAMVRLSGLLLGYRSKADRILHDLQYSQPTISGRQFLSVYSIKQRAFRRRIKIVKNISLLVALKQKLKRPDLKNKRVSFYTNFCSFEKEAFWGFTKNIDLTPGVLQSSEGEEAYDSFALADVIRDPLEELTASEHGDIPDVLPYHYGEQPMELSDLEKTSNFPIAKAFFETEFWKGFEVTQIAIRTLQRARDTRDVILALAQWYNAYTGKTVASLALKVIDRITDFVKSFSTNEEGSVQADENPFRRFRNMMMHIDSYQEHPIVVRLRGIMHYILSFSILERFGISYDSLWFTQAEIEASKATYSTHCGFVMVVVEGAAYIAERVYDCASEGCWSSILHNSASYGKWADEVYQIKEDSHKLHNPEACGIDYHSFIERLRLSCEQGENILKYSCDLTKNSRVTVQRLLSEVRLIQASELTKKAARQTRESPFTFLLYGGSSVGKSTLSDLLFYAMAKAHDLPSGDEFRYQRTFSDDYYSGFTSAVWFLLLDELAAANPDLQDDNSVKEIQQIINNAAFVPPQADLADKGKTPCRPKVVMGTTNVKRLHASIYYSNALAIARRFNFTITVTVKKKYSIDPTQKPFMRMLDPAKMPKTPGIPDVWTFTVERTVARMAGNKQDFDFVRAVEKDIDIFGLIQFLCHESKKHFEIQERITASKEIYKDISMCKVCYRTDNCICEVQSQFVEEIVDTSLKAVIILFFLTLTHVLYRIKIWLGSSSVSEIVTRSLTNTARTCISDAMAAPREVINKRLIESSDYLADLRQKICSLNTTAANKINMERRKVVEYMRRVGSKMQQSRIKNPLLYGLISFIPTVVVGWKTYQYLMKSQEIQTSWDEGSSLNYKDEKPNPWYRDDYVPEKFQVGRLSSSWKSLPREQVIQEVATNCFNCIVRRTKEDGSILRADCRLLCVVGHVYVTNAHSMHFSGESLELTLAFRPTNTGLGSSFKYTLFKRDCHFVEDRDLVFFRLDSIPPRKRLVDLFPTRSFKTVCSGVLINRSETGVVTTQSIQALKDGQCTLFTPSLPCVFGVSEYDTVMGDCGSTMLGFTPSGPVLLGIHVQGGKNCVVGSARIYREDITEAIMALGGSEIQASTPDLKDAGGNEQIVSELHHKSTFRFIDEGVCSVYGSFAGFRAKSKSNVVPTLIAKAVQARGYPIETGAPMMNSWIPWRKGALDITGQTFNVSRNDALICAKAFAADVIRRLDASQFEEMIVLSNDIALNGQPGVKFIDKMNRNTSMGFPWRSKKSNFLSQPEVYEDWQDYVRFDDSFYLRVDKIIANYRSGKRHMPVYIMHLKDEPRALEKVKEGSTRIFGGAPADWSFVMRKYLLAFVRVVQNNKYIFEAAPGTNATSYEWDEMYHYLTTFGTGRMIAGDFSKYDKRMSGTWILAAFEFITIILREAGWSDEDICVVHGLAEDTAFPLCDFNGDLVEFWGSNPSGHPLTVIINCIAHSLYFRYVWLKVGNNLSEFQDYVHLMTYGDDDVANISSEVVNYNHTIIQEELGKIGVKYTMADKESKSVPFLEMKDIVFLQRAWRYEPELGSHLAALNEKSISKMLTMCIPSKVVCPEQYAVDILQNALREYFFHGRDAFEKHKAVFLDVISEVKLENYFEEFPDYDVLKLQYLEDCKEVWPEGRCPLC